MRTLKNKKQKENFENERKSIKIYSISEIYENIFWSKPKFISSKKEITKHYKGIKNLNKHIIDYINQLGLLVKKGDIINELVGNCADYMSFSHECNFKGNYIKFDDGLIWVETK